MSELISARPPLVLMALTAVLSLVGCASFTPRTFHCSDGGGVRPSAPGERVSTDGLSIRSPSGGEWCTGVPGVPGVAFMRSDLVGRYVAEQPARAEVTHTFVAGGLAVRVKDADVSSPQALQEFVSRWHRAGIGVTEVAGDLYADLSTSARITDIRSRVDLAPRADADCVRYDLRYTERNHPGAGGADLVLRNEGELCRHPDDARTLVSVFFSERHEVGWERPELWRRFHAEAAVTLDSLEFAPL